MGEILRFKVLLPGFYYFEIKLVWPFEDFVGRFFSNVNRFSSCTVVAGISVCFKL